MFIYFISDIHLKMVFSPANALPGVTIMCHLFYVVDQAIKHPLYVYLHFTAISKPVHSLLTSDIGEYRLYRGKSFRVNRLALRTVYFLLHLLRKIKSLFLVFNIPQRDEQCSGLSVFPR